MAINEAPIRKTEKHDIMRLWEILTEMTGAETVVATSPGEGHLLAETEEVSTEAETEETEPCIKLSAATAEKNAKYLSSQQAANRFTAATVLKKWAEENSNIRQGPKDPTLDPPLRVLTTTKLNLTH